MLDILPPDERSKVRTAHRRVLSTLLTLFLHTEP